ncbi:MAG: hypothetical protein SCK29_00180 [Bacillota bacterium]|nr:hypothetical protein [Bacillota bacterium]MDW7682517.1 hypothetical protein [Bacillota bacterium]
MDIRDQALLELWQKTLTERVSQQKGVLYAPEVLHASRELDKMILKFMLRGRNDNICRR